MDTELVVLRLLHIVPGAVWVGSAVFLALLLEPALRQLGPGVQGPVMGVLAPVSTRVMSIAAGITIVAGLALVARTPGRGFDDLFTNGWGWAIGLGLVAAVLAAAAGGAIASTTRSIGSLAEGGGAGAARIPELQGRLRLLGRSNAALTIIAVALMASARFV